MNPRPKCIPRTSETELHLMGNLLDRHQGKAFYATEKLDGFSMSFFNSPDGFIASCRDHLVREVDDSAFGSFLRCNRFEVPRALIFQGELVGPGIRGNRYGLERLEFYVFDVLRSGVRINFEDACEVVSKAGLRMVPLIFSTDNLSREVCAIHCTGKSRLNPSVQREGIVCRTMVETSDEFQGRVSFKVFNPDYPFHH